MASVPLVRTWTALCALLALGCSGAFDPATGIAVEVRRGPIQPVDQVGVDNTAPVAGASVVVVRLGRPFAGARTDSAGLALVPVPAGDYQVSVATCPGALAVPGPVAITVLAGSLTPARLECDTGIR